MPYDDNRQTACISSQAGCALGCVFCATGQMGFGRHLSATEIFEQAMIFARDLAARGERLSNVVFMGMGEPFHNYDASPGGGCYAHESAGDRRAPHHHQHGGLGAADPPLSPMKGLQVKLAVSLHKTDDSERSALLPVNRRWPLAELMDACRYYVERTNRRITFEWAAIAGENDTSRRRGAAPGSTARGIALPRQHHSLNPTGGYGGRPAPALDLERFLSTCVQYGVIATVRVRRGIDIDAGCGQLKTAVIDAGDEVQLARGEYFDFQTIGGAASCCYRFQR